LLTAEPSCELYERNRDELILIRGFVLVAVAGRGVDPASLARR
jgi:hypothetical protein